MGFSSKKAEQPLQSMELHKKEEEKYEKDMEKLIRKNLKKKGVYQL